MSGPRKVPNMFALFRNRKHSCGHDQLAAARPLPAARNNPLGTTEESLGARASGTSCGGFTLIEMLVSIAVLSVIMGGVVSAISTAEQTFRRTEQKTDMYENVRGVAELMAQEVGQAGLVSLPTTTPTLGAAVAIGATTATVSATTSMFVGETLLLDAGTNEELITLTALTSTTITFTPALLHAHATTTTTLKALGSFISGVVPTTATNPSTAFTLNLFGDVNGDGTLVYVRYVCAPGTTSAPGTLTRSITTITPGVNTVGTAQTLLSTVIGPSAGCFQYSQATTAATGTSLTFVTSVGFTVSVQATSPDPQTGAYATMTKSFLNLSPRNVAAGLEQATNAISTRLQASPPNVALY